MFERPTEAQNAAAAENVAWFLDRRSKDPRLASALPPKVDPVLAKELAENNAAHTAKLSKVALRRRKAQLFTALYDKPSEVLDLCDKRTPGDFPSTFGEEDWITIGKLALQRANDELQFQGIPPITQQEAGEIATFLTANDIYMGGDGAMLAGFSILVFEGVLRPQVVSEVQPEPEPVPETNPFPYDSNPRSDHSQWDMAQYRREKERELSGPFRDGALSLGIELSSQDMRRLHQRIDQMRLPMTAANVRTAGIALWGEQVNMTDAECAEFETNREDAGLSGEEMKRKYGFVASYDPNRGANIRRS